MRKKLLLLGGISLIFLIHGCGHNQQQAAIETFNQQLAGVAYVGDSTCADCHEDLVASFSGNEHMKVADWEVNGMHKGCEGCHGPGAKHVDGDGDTSKIISYQSKTVPAFIKSSVCIACHSNSDELMSWKGSTHNMSNVACSDCHDIHNGKGPAQLKSKSITSQCLTCHQDKLGKVNMPSHHPIKEGHMDCTDCHNPHSGDNKFMLRTDGRENDLCFKCHADKEGPFVFEHAPVVEKCSLCHEPHGTVANNLLRQNEPFLCLQCHHLHFHAALKGNEHIGTSSTYAVQQVMTTKCTQCHSQVHGSNLPSNTAGGMGRRLTR